MSTVSEDEWRDAMFRIFERLEDHQFKKMVEFFKKHNVSSPSMMTARFRGDLPKTLIQRFGIKDSILLVNKAMQEIPRIDPGVQDLLRPFMEKQEVGPEASSRPEKLDSAGAEEPGKNQDGSPGSTQSHQKTLSPTLRKTVRDLKASGNLGQKFLAVRVVQKSDLQKYETKNKEENDRFFLGVADESDAIRVQVFGSERFPTIEEGRCYTFRNVLMDPQAKVVEVTKQTRVSKTGLVHVPKNVELEAGNLIYSPVYSVKDVQTLDGWKENQLLWFGFEQFGSIEPVQMKAKQMKKDKLDFVLADGTGSIRISLWGEDTRHLDGIAEGDVVRIHNLSTNRFKNNVSLNSTNFTKTTKVQSAAVQTVTIQIIGIGNVGSISTELEVEINDQLKTLEVASRLLAEGFGLSLEDDLEDKLLQRLPCAAEAEIQGNKIKLLRAAE